MPGHGGIPGNCIADEQTCSAATLAETDILSIENFLNDSLQVRRTAI